jgi:ABC-type uncharacterized transport system permease subunit
LTYPRNYRQEKTYGFSWIGIAIALIIVGVIMGVVVILSGAIIVIFPFGGVSNISIDPGQSAALSAELPYYLTLIVVVPFAGVIGSWLHYHFHHKAAESEETTPR